jgi:hypothetical protein
MNKLQEAKWRIHLERLKIIDEKLKNKPPGKSNKELDAEIVQDFETKYPAETEPREMATRYLAYRLAPDDVRKEYEGKKDSFTKIAGVCKAISAKVPNVPRCVFVKRKSRARKRGNLSKDALSEDVGHAIIRSAVLLSSKDDYLPCAEILRKEVVKKRLTVIDNEFVPTATGWRSLGAKPELIEADDTFEAELDRAIKEATRDKDLQGYIVDRQASFMDNIQKVFHKIEGNKGRLSKPQKGLRKALLPRPKITPSIALVACIGLERWEVPEQIVKQLRLIAYKEFRLNPDADLLQKAKEEVNETDLFFEQKGETDKPGERKIRMEQPKLRKLLLAGKEMGKCALCNETYRAESLVAAHKKLRSVCSSEEKQDLPDIAMLLCKFGCDHLYEEGFVLIEGGKIVKNRSKKKCNEEAFVKNLVDSERQLEDRWLKGGSVKYFDWHYTWHTGNAKKGSS